MSDFLSSLEPRIVPVMVTLPYGTPLELNMYSLSLWEWDEMGESVSDPLAPFVMHNSRGEEVRNYADPKYLRERRKAETERAFKRVTMGLVKGGNDIEGVLFEDKVKAVKEKLDSGIASALMRWQSDWIMQSRVRVLNAGATFPSVETDSLENTTAGESYPDGVDSAI